MNANNATLPVTKPAIGNPGIDPEVLKEARRMRRMLIQLGLLEERKAPFRHPFAVNPAVIKKWGEPRHVGNP